MHANDSHNIEDCDCSADRPIMIVDCGSGHYITVHTDGLAHRMDSWGNHVSTHDWLKAGYPDAADYADALLQTNEDLTTRILSHDIDQLSGDC